MSALLPPDEMIDPPADGVLDVLLQILRELEAIHELLEAAA